MCDVVEQLQEGGHGHVSLTVAHGFWIEARTMHQVAGSRTRLETGGVGLAGLLTWVVQRVLGERGEQR